MKTAAPKGLRNTINQPLEDRQQCWTIYEPRAKVEGYEHKSARTPPKITSVNPNCKYCRINVPHPLPQMFWCRDQGITFSAPHHTPIPTLNVIKWGWNPVDYSSADFCQARCKTCLPCSRLASLVKGSRLALCTKKTWVGDVEVMRCMLLDLRGLLVLFDLSCKFFAGECPF